MLIMFVWFLAVSPFVLGLFVVTFTGYLSKSKRLGNSKLRSHPRKAPNEVSSNGSSSCQMCHMCGGLRLRSPNTAIFDDTKTSQLNSFPHVAGLDQAPRMRSRPHREYWAAMKTQISLSIQLVVRKVLSHKKRQNQGDFLRWLLSLRHFSLQKAFSDSKSMCVVPARVSALEGSSVRSSECGLDSISNAVKSDLAHSSIGTIAGIPSSEANSNLAIRDMVKSRSIQGAADTDTTGAPTHRLVLEILVSPSGNTDDRSQSSCPASGSGLTLKLETNAMLEHLDGCSETLKSIAKKCEHSVHTPQGMHLSKNVLSKASGTRCAFEDKASQILDEAVLEPDAGMNFSGKLSSGGKPFFDSILTSRECFDQSQMTGQKDNGQSCDSLHSNVKGESIQDTVLCDVTGKHSNITGPLKFSIGNHQCRNAVSDMASNSTIEVKDSTLGSDVASTMPLSGLGSLRITLLKSDAQEESAEKAISHVGSALASLNVAGKPSGGSGLSNQKKEKWSHKSETSCSLSPTCVVSVEQVTASACEEKLVGKEDQSLLQVLTDTSLNGDLGSSSKKEKKKKKNKGKKSKEKTRALMANAQEMQEIGKIALEATKHVSAVPEREIGCVCGASKGQLHAETCPYPFTSSGSMLQRKIKEQYNHLVRSNAAKALTLAQVGQFTSCLVEAKATLQQKSESIQRKFTIMKSLLSKAEKSSFDRLCGQIYGLEMEQKKLEEDTVVYNRLQEQLKLSPAYKKMLEYGRAHFELHPHTGQMIEKLEPEDSEMSFEELLAQEKKDAFWQRHRLARSAVSAS